MQITSFSIFRYKLPLTAPLKFPMRHLYRREGLLLRIASEDGSVGWGEAAPLPGFSREHLQQATRQAFKLKRVMTGRSVADDWSSLEEIVGKEVDESGLVPSVHFGFDMGARALRAEVNERTLLDTMDGAGRTVVSVNGLLAGEREDVLKDARRMREEGYRAVKLKVGQPDVQADIELVKAVSEALGPAVTLRLDANQAWDLDEAEAFAKGIADVRIEFIEEPLYDPMELPDFVDSTELPVALDESLLDLTPEELEEHDYAQAVIIKPTLLGGLSYVRHMATRAIELGMTPIISGAYEGGVGTMGLATLAASIGEQDMPAGLDTYRWLEKDVVRPRIKMDGGKIDITSMLGTKRTMNGHMLREV